MIALMFALCAAPDPAALLRAADAVRNPSASFVMQARVTSSERPDAPALFDVSIQGNDKTLVKTLEPVRDRGRNLLMLGEDMWAYVPNIERALRVSLAQRLSGQAANGDISRMRWSGDYTPTIEGGDEAERGDAWVLHLAANKKGLTYDRLRVWVAKDSCRPLKAEFLSLAGKVLKTATYQGYREMAGSVRPGEVVIQDGLRPDQRSVIEIVSMKPRDLPAALFSQRSLR